MTDEAMISALAELDGSANLFTLMKRGLYYRPNSKGYTSNISEAWLISESEADKFVYPHDEPVTKHRAPNKPFLTDYNPILKLIQKQSLEIKRAIAQQLLMIQESFYMLDATPRQLCIVLLKAHNLYYAKADLSNE